MKTNNFSVMPSVSISRSKFVRKSQHKTSFNLGEIVPIYVDEVLPGDTRKIDIGSLVRMPSLIAPLMDNIYLDIYSFWCPNRLVFNAWKRFMGENTNGAGIISTPTPSLPKVNLNANGIPVGSLGHHLGLPYIAPRTKNVEVSAFPGRVYRLIYNRFFRDQNLIAPVTVANAGAGSYDLYHIDCFKAAKKSDYFTRALPYAQKGAPVTIPLGTDAPVYWDADTNLIAGGQCDLQLTNNDSTRPVSSAYTFSAEFPQVGADGVSLRADLSQATAATINQLRFAFQYQKMLEKDALYGTRYWEIIKAHFGVVAPDASLQDPEYLGHRRINISINQVTQTTGSNQATPSQNTLGATGAVSVTGDAGNILTKSFTEHGYIMILAVARHDQTYSQGIERMWSRTDRTDFYFPVFANLGAQEVKNKEIFVSGTAIDEEVFGFQEAWAEYRYKSSKSSGLLDPAAPNSLGWWTLSNNFASLPTLSQSFIEQDRNALGRVLSTGTTGPDFIADFAFIDTAVRPMPLYSVPGLIDHH